MRSKAIVLAIILAAGAQALVAAEKPATKSRGVPQGRYACVFHFGGTFFDSKPIHLLDGNRYEAASGTGTWKYEAATRQVTFSGILARDYGPARYFAAGLIPGGLKNKKGPALVLKPSAAARKQKGMEAVPLYCYLSEEKR
jgi:hypothetical protein